MTAKIILLLLVYLSLNASDTLQENYFVDSDDIYISNIVKIKSGMQDKKLFSVETGSYTKKIKSKELIRILKSHGYKGLLSSSRYVRFTKNSPIDTSPIINYIKKHYEKKYKHIIINKVSVMPRGYVKSLPQKYLIKVPRKNHLKNHGVVHIKTSDKKKVFFDYTIDATLSIYVAKVHMKRGTELSVYNTKKKTVVFDRFRDLPIQEIKEGVLQSKHQIKLNEIITLREVEGLNLVKRDSNVNVSLNNKNMGIEFSAKSLEDGKLNNIITVVNRNGKRFKVVVIGKNRAEMR